jgi:hypothetical protein
MELHGEYFANIARANGMYNCPNCGAPIESDKCPYCGTFIIDFACFDTEKPFFMKIKRGDEVFIVKVRMRDASIYYSADELMYGDVPNILHHVSRSGILTATIDIL